MLRSRLRLNRVSSIVVFLLLLIGSLGAAQAKEKARDWQSGVLIDVQTHDASHLVNGTTVSRAVWIYTIDDGSYVWQLQRGTNRHDEPLSVTINAPIKFSIDKQKAYLLDEQGKEHELSVMTKSLKKKD
jgi:hypothetical protein